MKTTKMIKRIISFILLTAVFMSMSLNCAFATENKYNEKEYLKQFISEEYIVDDKVIQDYEKSWITGNWTEYDNYFGGYHRYQSGLSLYFKPINTDQEFLEKFQYNKLTTEDIINAIGNYINLDNSSYYWEVWHPYKIDGNKAFVTDYETYEIMIHFYIDWDQVNDIDLYYLRAKLFVGVSMSMEANDGLRTENGMDIHCGPVVSGVSEYAQGDINLDGKTGVRDMLLLKKYIAGMSPRVFIENCDLNYDGKINATDTISLKKIIVG